MNVLLYLIIFLLIIFLIITAIFLTRAAKQTINTPGYAGDSNLKSAHSLLTWGSVISWSLVAIGFILLFAAITGGLITGISSSKDALSVFSANAAMAYSAAKKYSESKSIYSRIIMLLTFLLGLLVLTNGILAAIAASLISSSVLAEAAADARSSAITAAVIGISSVVVLAIGTFLVIFFNRKLKSKYEKTIDAIADELDIDTEKLKRLFDSNPETAAAAVTAKSK